MVDFKNVILLLVDPIHLGIQLIIQVLVNASSRDPLQPQYRVATDFSIDWFLLSIK